MKQGSFELIAQKNIAQDVYEMQLHGDISAVTAPGQFVNVAVPGFTLRRPISVCNIEPDEGDLSDVLLGAQLTGTGTCAWSAEGVRPSETPAVPGTLTLTYKVLGEGTKVLATLEPGTILDVLTGLGNGYSLAASGNRPLLVGGGVGTPPLYLLARQLRDLGKEVTVILGFNSAADVFYRDEFEALGCRVYVTTVDGSVDHKGFVTDVMEQLEDQAARVQAVLETRLSAEAFAGEDDNVDMEAEIAPIVPAEEEPLCAYTYVYACGPKPMLQAVANRAQTSGQLSMEERMGCGFGACMGCTLVTAKGPKRVCADGPVFVKEDLLW